jgi:HD-GYP domain-containing protein (c-di-GMP phosphodiesterase class II)
MLNQIEFLHPCMDIPSYHHERWDGSGYPDGLTGEKIPVTARIFAVIDVWDALTSDRPYRKAWPTDAAVQYIRENAGKHFDPQVTDIFIRWIKSRVHDRHEEKTVPTHFLTREVSK